MDPALADRVAHVDNLLAGVGHDAHRAARPVQDLDRRARIAVQRQAHPCGGLVHGQELAAALVVVVREHRSADAGQRGVAPEEVSGETVDEIQQMTEGVAVHMHRRVLGVHADAVLVEIAVRGELPEPVLSAERDRHRAQRALVAPGESLVLVANRAGRVASGHRVAGRQHQQADEQQQPLAPHVGH